jgi:hypothetical protein
MERFSKELNPVSHWNGMGPNGAILRGVPMTIMGAENK